MKEYNIRHRKSSPYHPQENGQEKVTNKETGAILTKTVQIYKKDQSSRLAEAAWAYRTTWKTTTSFTPFELVYGKTTMMSIQFEHKTLRTALKVNIDLPTAQEERILHLNSLDEMRKTTLHKT